MEALAVIGLVSNLLGFIDTTTKLCALLKECSSVAGAPTEVVAISNRLDLAIRMIKELDSSGHARLDHEKFALQIYQNEAEELRVFLEGLKIVPCKASDPPSRLKWLSRKRASLSSSVENGWKAFKALRGKEKLDKFQVSLDRILGLVMMQQQSRIEATTLRVDDRTSVLVQNSETIIRGLGDLQLLANQPPTDIAAMQTKTIFMVPLARNSGFLCREEVMLKLDQIYFSQSPPEIGPKQVQTAALCGLGGIGKSQIALEYAFRQRGRTPNSSIFWIYASTVSRFEESYKRIAKEFQLPGQADPQIDVLQLVRNWFESQYQPPWLMVVDNVDDAQIFARMPSGKSPLEYLPKLAGGSILFTSRNRDVAMDLANDPITVTPLSVEEARMLLRERTNRTSTDAEMDALLHELDYLPLAITQAASYMTKRNKTVSQYLALFRDSETSRIKLLEHQFVDAGREAKSLESVATTWFISFQHIKSQNPRVANLLFLMSLMDRQGIPTALITSDQENPVDFEEAVGALEAFSFISVEDLSANYSMHRLVQTITRAWLNDYGDALFIQTQALNSLSSRFPNGEFETWETCARYLPHAESVLSCLGSRAHAHMLNRSNLLRNLGWYFKGQGKYDLARMKLKESIDIYINAGNAGWAEALNAKRKLARVIEQQGHPEDAIKLFREVLESQEDLLGQDHLETLDTVDKLAVALANTLLPERRTHSEEMARRSLRGRQLVLAENHPKITESLRTLGWVLYREGKYNESEEHLRKCLQGRKMVLGNRHPKTTSTANDLALALVKLDPPKYEEAESLLRDSANLAVLLCGTDHPNSIVIHSNLCTVLRRVGKHDEAETLQREQLIISERVLGQNHPTTIWCIVSMAESLLYQKKYSVAKSFVEKELEKRPELAQQVVSLPNILILIDILGHVCEELGQFRQAEEHFELVRTGRLRVLGDDNPTTLQSEHCLARVQLAQGKCGEARGFLQQLISKEIRILGEKHEETILSTRLLGIAMLGLREFSEAEQQFRKVLIDREEILGSDHEFTLIARDNIESALKEQGKWEDLVKSCRESLAIRQRLAPDAFDTLRVMSNLWFALEQRGNSESDTIFDDLLTKIKTMPPDFMERKCYKKNMTGEEEWYFRRLRNGSFDLETLRARERVAAWYEAKSDFRRAQEIYYEVFNGIERTFGPLNEEVTKFLRRRGKPQKPKKKHTIQFL
ncbi:hypothetical protein B0J14DRAFT_523480 [Halenospora varia]|nr:hypothetical protein B0J14DRAFT_523480 [Halenospora varia]